MPDTPQKGRIVQLAKGMKIQPSNKPDDDRTGLVFDTDWGEITVVLDSPQLGLLIAMILNDASSKAPKKSGNETLELSFDPINADGVGVAKGPTPNTAYISVFMGKVNMSFVVNKTALQSTYATLAREIL